MCRQSARALRSSADADRHSAGESSGGHALTRTAADLYWIPLGAGGRCVRFNDRVFEAIHAARQRQRCDLCPLLTTSGSRYMR
jgi:hypothetical protein